MAKKHFVAALGLLASASIATPSNAARIMNAQGVTRTPLQSGDNLNNMSLAGTVYLFNEGVNNGIQSFLLHYERTDGQVRVHEGSFDIFLEAGDDFLNIARTTNMLQNTDPTGNGVTYSRDADRGLESGSSLFADTVTAGNPNPIRVTFSLSTDVGNPDEARFRIRVGAIPEPATWAMMLVGFGMVGAASRYRRRDAKATYA